MSINTNLPTPNSSDKITYSSCRTGPTTQPDIPTSLPSTQKVIGHHNSHTDLNPSYSSNHQTSMANPSTTCEPLNAHHRPSLDTNTSSDMSGLARNTTIRRPWIAQNAPGKAGETGENVMGSPGYGVARVERQKEEQGVGGKFVGNLGV